MTEETLIKLRKREKRYKIFLTASAIFHVLALCVFFFLIKLGGGYGVLYVGLAFFGIGSILSGIAGLHSDFSWYVVEKVVYSQEQREELLKMCEKLD